MTYDPALSEALVLIDDAQTQGIPLRLVGGMAVRYLCAGYPPRIREGQDLDIASTGVARKSLTAFLVNRGLVPDKNFNALYGHKQLYFRSPDNQQTIDILVDSFEMCHVLEFKNRLERMPRTLDLTDLLLSKLQIVELNSKDVQDICYLLAKFRVDEGDAIGFIGLSRIGELVSTDWGWWRTITLNLVKVHDLVTSEHLGPAGPLNPENAEHDLLSSLMKIHAYAEEVPKTGKWKLRSKIGEKKKWYQEPEEVPHD
jgi:hypothetical protein